MRRASWMRSEAARRRLGCVKGHGKERTLWTGLETRISMTNGDAESASFMFSPSTTASINCSVSGWSKTEAQRESIR
jgi:hypothetical protein